MIEAVVVAALVAAVFEVVLVVAAVLVAAVFEGVLVIAAVLIAAVFEVALVIAAVLVAASAVMVGPVGRLHTQSSEPAADAKAPALHRYLRNLAESQLGT